MARYTAENPDRSFALLSNMDGNGWDRMIQTPLGNWQPFEADDHLVVGGKVTPLPVGRKS